jgi:hypothetical protein
MSRVKRDVVGREHTRSLGSPGNTLVEIEALDGTGSSLAQLLLGLANELSAVGADETARVGKLCLVIVLELLHHAHVLQNTDGWGAHGITAVLITGERLLVEQRNLGQSETRDGCVEANLDTLLGSIITENRTRRSSSNNNNIVGTSGKGSLGELAREDLAYWALSVSLEEAKVRDNEHGNQGQCDVQKHPTLYKSPRSDS